VMTDIYDYLEMEKIRFLKEKNKELCLEDEWFSILKAYW
jgi:hypothetical protein